MLHVGANGCVHPIFTHDPSTLCLRVRPDLLNLPQRLRSIFCAPAGHLFWSVRYVDIETILVGYFAGIDWMRLAGPVIKRDSDDQERGHHYNHLVHGCLTLDSPLHTQQTIFIAEQVVVPIRDIKRFQSEYFERYSAIRTWHRRVTGLDDTGNYTEQEGAHQRGWLRSPFGNVHRFFDVLSHVKGPKGWELRYGPDAKRAVSFLPQSCARVMLTRAAQRLPSEVKSTLRLFLRDGVLGLAQDKDVARCLLTVTEEMEHPVPELGGLVVLTGATSRRSWGEMV